MCGTVKWNEGVRVCVCVSFCLPACLSVCLSVCGIRNSSENKSKSLEFWQQFWKDYEMRHASMGVIINRCTITGSGQRVFTPYSDEWSDSHVCRHGCHCSPVCCAVLNKAEENCVVCETEETVENRLCFVWCTYWGGRNSWVSVIRYSIAKRARRTPVAKLTLPALYMTAIEMWMHVTY